MAASGRSYTLAEWKRIKAGEKAQAEKQRTMDRYIGTGKRTCTNCGELIPVNKNTGELVLHGADDLVCSGSGRLVSAS